METYLYYSYLKFRHDNQKRIWVILRSIPWWIWVSFVISIVGISFGSALYQATEGGGWSKLLLIIGIIGLGLFSKGIEHIQIVDSTVRFTGYWKYIEKVRQFLADNGVRTTDDVELIQHRIEKWLLSAKQEMQALKENDEKWLQTLAIPVILAIITTALNQQGSMDETISEIFGILYLFFVAFCILVAIVTLLRSSKKWEIDNLTEFAEDLQGVLDSERFGFKANVAG